MSRIGQHVQQLQEGEPESFEPDPEYDWQDEQKNDPGYEEHDRAFQKTVRRDYAA